MTRSNARFTLNRVTSVAAMQEQALNSRRARVSFVPTFVETAGANRPPEALTGFNRLASCSISVLLDDRGPW
jgi:hypothetical protein